MNFLKQKWSFRLIALSLAFAFFMATGTVVLGTGISSPDAPSSTVESPQADTVEVVLSDGSLNAPSTVASGSVTFVVQNQGQEAHGFALSGPVKAGLEKQIAAGQEQTFTAELKPGSYMAFCSVEGHRQQESAEIVVE